MKQVLLFPKFESPQKEQEPIFLAFICREGTKHLEKLSTLSPKIMCWGKGIYLVDLSFCNNYWQLMEKQRRLPKDELWAETLEQEFANEDYYAGLSSQAWRSLLLAYNLEKLAITKLLHESSIQAKNIMVHCSWDIWWRAAEELLAHQLEQEDISQGQMRSFQQNLRKMEIAMKRLSCQKPYHIRSTPPHQIGRRYGCLMEILWQWSYHDSDDSLRNSLDSLEVFPWKDDSEEQETELSRHLDQSLFQWDQVEAYLQEDLNKICLSPSFHKEDNIMTMEWQLVLEDLSEPTITIAFRNPHNLHQDTPLQRTALLQAQYQFDAYRRSQRKHYREIDLIPPGITSWKIRIKQRMRRPSHDLLIFDQQASPLQDLLQLENQVASPLHAYYLVQNWLPEDAYHVGSYDKSVSHELHSHQDRPLFTYTYPQALTPGPNGSMWRFTERTMDKWWSSPQQNLRRDYYQYINDGRRYWAFRDQKGKWFIHGVFS